MIDFYINLNLELIIYFSMPCRQNFKRAVI